MLKVIEEANKNGHCKGGHPCKLSLLDKLVIMLFYYREYRTMDSISFTTEQQNDR